MKSLGDIFRHALPHHTDREAASTARDTEVESPYLLLGQKSAVPQAPHAAPQPAAVPSRKEVLNYLGDLADDYHVPRKLVYAVADAESSLDPEKRHYN